MAASAFFIRNLAMATTILPPTKYASKSNTTINDLCDDSLIEIFCRLPCKTVFSCKSVSKHWFALVSNPNFRSIYLTHQHSLLQNYHYQTKGEDLDQQSFILKQYIKALVTTPNVSFLQLGCLSFLASYFKLTNIIPQRFLLQLEVLGCSNGLLLCRYKCIYYVCNPLTRDTLELPAPPKFYDNNDGILLGFMCDPYYHVELEGVSVVTSLRRFRVVRIPTFSGKKFAFKVELFSSETGKWNRFVLSCPKGFEFGLFLPTWGVEHDGKLYFLGRRMILVYDPYNVPQVAYVIDYPSDFGHEIYTECLGVSCGRLQFSQSQYEAVRPYNRRVWELEYFDCGQKVKAAWRLVHEFYLPHIIGPFLEDQLKPIRREFVSPNARIIAFHPYVRGILFLEFGDHIISCNLLTKRYNYKATKYGGPSMFRFPVIPIVLPWWPTPIPSLPSS